MPQVNECVYDDRRSHHTTPIKCPSESALQQHTRSSERQERLASTRSKTAPIHDYRKINEPSSRSTAQHYASSKQPHSPTSIEHMSAELCQDTQGTLSPMERFVKLSLANDPSPWETKKALKKSGFQDDHTQDLELKLNAAAIAAVGVFTQKVGEPSVVAVAGSI